LRALKAVWGPARVRGLLGVALLVLIVAIVVSASSGGGSAVGPAPATGAASVTPADALAYVHISTEESRPAVKRALALADHFAGFPLLLDGLAARLRALAKSGGTISFADDIRPWLGDEAALALLDTGTSTAAPLIVLDVANRGRAQAFLSEIGATHGAVYRGAPLYERPGAELAFASHYLVVGSDASVRAALDVAAGRAPSLAGDAAYQQAAAGEPADRVLDAYASAVGVRRVLVAQGGLAGALGVLLYQPALTGVAMSLSAAAPGARILIHRALDPHLAAIAGPPAKEFEPSLEGQLPSGSTLALDVPDLERAAPHVLDAGATGGIGGAIGPLLSRLGGALRAQGVDVSGLESIFSGESAVAIAPTPGHPSALVIVARAPNEAQARTELATAEVPLSQLFGSVSSSGVVPAFTERVFDGVTAHQLPLAAGFELDYAVFRGLVVISTSLSGIAAVASHTHTLAENPEYRETLAGSPSRVTSLLFLDFSQLLSLAEQTGLIRGVRFDALRADLDKVGAVGLSSTSGETDSTAELYLQIS
jgi:hypothetical protein